jgi:hypothetical protein
LSTSAAGRSHSQEAIVPLAEGRTIASATKRNSAAARREPSASNWTLG